MKGYLGKVLLVDLSSGEITPEEIDDKIYEKYMSGMGLGAYYLHKNIPEDADPLGPENILGFISGLLTGTGSLMTGRWMVVCKSPLTGGWGDANCGGTLSPFIKISPSSAILTSIPSKGLPTVPIFKLLFRRSFKVPPGEDSVIP